MSETKSSLEELIQKQATKKYEDEDLLNLAFAFQENGFDNLFHTYGDLVLKSFGDGYRWNINDGRKDFEETLRGLFSNYDEFKKARIKQIEDTITENTLEQLSTVQKLLESRDN